jgi:hypothetical protein
MENFNEYIYRNINYGSHWNKKKKKGKEEIPRNSKIENNWFLIIKLVDIIRSFIIPKKKKKNKGKRKFTNMRSLKYNLVVELQGMVTKRCVHMLVWDQETEYKITRPKEESGAEEGKKIKGTDKLRIS